MQLTRIIQLPDTLSTTEKAEFLQDVIVYLHDQLEEAESVPVQRAFGFIGTTGAIAAAWSICGLGMVAPVVAIPGVIVIAGMTILSGVTLTKDVIESPEIVDLLHRLVHVLESKEIDQWVKLWEEVGTESFLKRLHYSCMGSFTGKGVFRHKSGSHPFDVAALFGGNKQVKPWEKLELVNREPKTSVIGQNTHKHAIDVNSEQESDSLRDSEEHRTPDPLPITQPPTPHTLPPFDRNRIINESKGLMIIGDMGAAKTCVAQHIANGFNGYGIIVFDPHGMTDWGNAYVVTKMGAIYEQMRILLDLLENGDTTPLLIICDEWLEIRGDRRNKKGSEYAGLADDFIRLFSTKPRKFNKLAAFVLHSPNVEAAGVDSFLRENYLKIYLGRLAKKEFPHIKDCAYPCVLEDEQQEHPTHGHHTEFKPKGKAPRNLEPLASAPINIPVAYMKGSEVEVCDRGWDGQLRLEVESIRQRLELLLDSSTPEPNPEPSEPTVQDSEPLNRTPEPPKHPVDEGCTDLGNGSQFSSGDSSERFTPLNLSKEQVLALVQNLNAELNQTQIIERLWQVKKGGSAAWKEAREQFKQLTGE